MRVNVLHQVSHNYDYVQKMLHLYQAKEIYYRGGCPSSLVDNTDFSSNVMFRLM